MTFAEMLYSAARPLPIDEHPFVVSVCEGQATREQIRSFGLHLASATQSFVRALYSILGECEDVRVRQSLIGNVLEEEGATAYVPAKGVTFDPAKHHPSMARRFARACGATDADLDAFRVSPPRWFVHALRSGNWLGPFAYVAVGTEANIPPTYRRLIPALKSAYGFSDSDLESLIEHVTADERHGLDGAMLIEEIATTEQERARALEGARRGGNGWWQILHKHTTSHALV